MNAEEIKKQIEEVLYDIRSRKMSITTGMLGAKQWTREMLVTMSKQIHEVEDEKDLPEGEIKKIEEKVEEYDWKPGLYKIDTETGMQYLGKLD